MHMRLDGFREEKHDVVCESRQKYLQNYFGHFCLRSQVRRRKRFMMASVTWVGVLAQGGSELNSVTSYDTNNDSLLTVCTLYIPISLICATKRQPHFTGIILERSNIMSSVWSLMSSSAFAFVVTFTFIGNERKINVWKSVRNFGDQRGEKNCPTCSRVVKTLHSRVRLIWGRYVTALDYQTVWMNRFFVDFLK